MNILDNELVRKYFRCEVHKGLGGSTKCQLCSEAMMAYRILRAMQEPIKKGDEFLNLDWDGGISGPWKAEKDVPCEKQFFGIRLRLPDRFQKQECYQTSIMCPSCNQPHQIVKPTPEPEKCKHGYEYPSHCMPCNGWTCPSPQDKPKDEVAPYSREVEEKMKTIKIGQNVVVKKDDGKLYLMKATSEPWLLGGHTEVIMLDKISGCYSLDRVTPISIDE